jgi:hypothetical protein
MKLLFDFNDTERIKVGTQIDVDFNRGEVFIGDEIEWDDESPLDISHSMANVGIESFITIMEELGIDYPGFGLYYFRANGINYEIYFDIDGDIEYIRRIINF